MDPSPLYLASASPRRRALIQSLERPVVVSMPPVDEGALEAAYAGASTGLAEHLAHEKARAAAAALTVQERGLRPGVLVAADTTVLLDGRVLGKPAHGDEAWTMLRALRGRAHQVITGVAVCKLPAGGAAPPGSRDAAGMPGRAGAIRSVSVTTTVHMRAYTDAEMAAYIDSGDPLDKAGGYAVQHPGFHPVARIEGCYTSVVGLPLCATAALVAQVESSDDRTGGVRTSEMLGREMRCPWSQRCRSPLPRLDVPTKHSCSC